MNTPISYITSDLIDRGKWDEWVRNADNRRIYATSVFLDIFSPGWDALVMGDGEAFMPLTRNRKFGVTYLFQPIFVQQLGLFLRRGTRPDCLPLFIDKLNSTFRFADIALNEMNSELYGKYDYAWMSNYLLRLNLPYELAAGKYSTNTRRNVIKAGRLGTEVRPHFTSSDVVRLFAGNCGRLFPNIRRKNYERLGRLLERGLAEGFVEIKSARATDGRVIAAACFLMDYDRYVFYFSANTQEGMEHGAMFLLIDSFIRQHSGSGKLLDFNGSMNQGLARFYSGFGAERAMYRRLKINRLWYPLKYFK